jgi:hypothetical protein
MAEMCHCSRTATIANMPEGEEIVPFSGASFS